MQLALFFVATSFLAMGIFITPTIAGREPPHQEKLAIALFGSTGDGRKGGGGGVCLG